MVNNYEVNPSTPNVQTAVFVAFVVNVRYEPAAQMLVVVAAPHDEVEVAYVKLVDEVAMVKVVPPTRAADCAAGAAVDVVATDNNNLASPPPEYAALEVPTPSHPTLTAVI